MLNISTAKVPNPHNPFIYNKLTLCKKYTLNLAVLHILNSYDSESTFSVFGFLFFIITKNPVTKNGIVEKRIL